MKSENIRQAILLAAALSGLAVRGFACGPFFPNNLLVGGDQAVLQPPIADFQRELARLKLPVARLHAKAPAAGQKYYEQSAELEMNDLAVALMREKVPSEQATVIMQAHLAERMKLNAFLKAREAWAHFYSGGFYDADGYHRLPNTNPPPVFPALAVTPGLPREFALYFQGAIAWQDDAGWTPCEYWNQLLELPPAKRHFKSTWAAFMLGKFYANRTNDIADHEALKYFEQVRALAKDGFADSSGLATASAGEEARIYLRRNNYEAAIELYLEQLAAGDDTAVNSLRFSAARAVAETNSTPAQLRILARNPRARRVITAYLISRNPYDDPREAQTDPAARLFFDRTTAWLEAVESADVTDVESASEFALAAYQASQMEIAQRWVNRAGSDSVAQWLQAKLLMRAGKIDEAAKLLAKVSRNFPRELPGTNAPAGFAQSLRISVNHDYSEDIAIGRQSLGELGVLHLARREYVGSLDALLRSGYWMDAAYVAEWVLTADELKGYVDHNWAGSAAKTNGEFANDYDYRWGAFDVQERIRWLLARRLADAGRYDEARPYFPAQWRTQLDAFTQKLRDSRNESLFGRQRAFALMAAAVQMRTNGMELVGTELAPDWFIEGGDFEDGVTWRGRAAKPPGGKVNVASDDEIGRAVRHDVQPNERWHYRAVALQMRYQAADLAWEVAQSLPDNADETARFLCIAGTWLKKINPPAADKFYKALVNRCRHTAIGAQADRMRWFPVLDVNGNPRPWPPPMRIPTESADTSLSNSTDRVFVVRPAGEKTYIVHAGDTLATIAQEAGTTVKALTEANPNLAAGRLRVGQVIFIPGPMADQAGANSAPEAPVTTESNSATAPAISPPPPR